MAYDVYISGRMDPIRIEADNHRYSEQDKTRRFYAGSSRVATFVEEKIDGIVNLNPENDGERQAHAKAGSRMVG